VRLNITVPGSPGSDRCHISPSRFRIDREFRTRAGAIARPFGSIATGRLSNLIEFWARLVLKWECRMTVRTLLVALCLLLCSELAAVSKSSAVYKDDPWNPHHIDSLPAEVRQYIARICKGPASAQHDFATYSPYEKRWRINLEYLRCNGLGEYRRGSQCLDVDFVAVVSRFRLVDKQYRDCGF
jgi:hypothetical protein